jgi:kynurenine formamidase
MCAPGVIESVQRELSRRGFLAALGASGVVAVATGAAQQKPVRLPKGFRDIVDLTHVFTPRLPVFPSFNPVRIRQRFAIAKDGFFANEVTFDEHTGTHMDAPAHFVVNASTVDRIPVDRFVAPLAVISIERRAVNDADTLLTSDDILAWEKRWGRLPIGAFVAMHSGWDGRIDDPDRFLNRDSKGTLHAPGFSEEAARFLARQRDIVGVGVDTLSLDAAAAPKFVAHLELLGAGKYGVELLANLARVPPAGATIVIGGPTHEGGSGGPVRALALV